MLDYLTSVSKPIFHKSIVKNSLVNVKIKLSYYLILIIKQFQLN